MRQGIHRGARYSAPMTRWWPDLAWLRNARHLAEAAIHPVRQQAARTLIRNARPRSILFVCNGNICRSPFAAALFAKRLPRTLQGSITVRSGGLIGPGRTPPVEALASAARRGTDISSHRSALVTEESLKAADLVVVMSAEQARDIRRRVTADSTSVVVLGDLDPAPRARRTISDPWGKADSAFDASYERIDRCVSALLQIIQDGR